MYKKRIGFTPAFALGDHLEIEGKQLSFFGSTALAYSISYEERIEIERAHNIKILCPQAWDLHHKKDRLLREEVEQYINGLTVIVVRLSWEGATLMSYTTTPAPFTEALKAKKQGAIIIKDEKQLQGILRFL